jgi:hypothetical protein
MATITVTAAADVVDAGDGVLSLREAVQQANATDAGPAHARGGGPGERHRADDDRRRRGQ